MVYGDIERLIEEAGVDLSASERLVAQNALVRVKNWHQKEAREYRSWKRGLARKESASRREADSFQPEAETVLGSSSTVRTKAKTDIASLLLAIAGIAGLEILTTSLGAPGAGLVCAMAGPLAAVGAQEVWRDFKETIGMLLNAKPKSNEFYEACKRYEEAARKTQESICAAPEPIAKDLVAEFNVLLGEVEKAGKDWEARTIILRELREALVGIAIHAKGPAAEEAVDVIISEAEKIAPNEPRKSEPGVSLFRVMKRGSPAVVEKIMDFLLAPERFSPMILHILVDVGEHISDANRKVLFTEMLFEASGSMIGSPDFKDNPGCAIHLFSQAAKDAPEHLSENSVSGLAAFVEREYLGKPTWTETYEAAAKGYVVLGEISKTEACPAAAAAKRALVLIDFKVHISDLPKLAHFFIEEFFIRLPPADQEKVLKEFDNNKALRDDVENNVNGRGYELAKQYLCDRGFAEIVHEHENNPIERPSPRGLERFLKRKGYPEQVDYFMQWIAAQPYVEFFKAAGIEKAGQFLSVRKGMLPEGFREAFEVFQDSGTPADDAEVIAVVRSAFGEDLASVFDTVDGADLAKPYFRRLKVGTVADTVVANRRYGKKIVLKVVTPSKKARVLKGLSRIGEVFAELEKRKDEFSGDETIRMSPIRLFEEFERSVRREMDMQVEAAQARTLVSCYPAGFVAPKIYDELTKQDILVMSFVEGTKVTDLTDPALRRKMAGKLLPAIAMQAMQGAFHSDPHPGNIFYNENTQEVALFDFGQIGELSVGLRKDLINLTIRIIQGNKKSVVKATGLKMAAAFLSSKAVDKALIAFGNWVSQASSNEPKEAPAGLPKKVVEHIEYTSDFDEPLRTLCRSPDAEARVVDFLEDHGKEEADYDRSALIKRVRGILAQEPGGMGEDKQPYIKVDRAVYAAEASGLKIKTPYSGIVADIFDFVQKYADSGPLAKPDSINFKAEVVSILRFNREGESMFPKVHRILLAAERFGYQVVSSAGMLIKSLLIAEGVKKVLEERSGPVFPGAASVVIGDLENLEGQFWAEIDSLAAQEEDGSVQASPASRRSKKNKYLPPDAVSLLLAIAGIAGLEILTTSLGAPGLGLVCAMAPVLVSKLSDDERAYVLQVLNDAQKLSRDDPEIINSLKEIAAEETIYLDEPLTDDLFHEENKIKVVRAFIRYAGVRIGRSDAGNEWFSQAHTHPIHFVKIFGDYPTINPYIYPDNITRSLYDSHDEEEIGHIVTEAILEKVVLAGNEGRKVEILIIGAGLLCGFDFRLLYHEYLDSINLFLVNKERLSLPVTQTVQCIRELWVGKSAEEASVRAYLDYFHRNVIIRDLSAGLDLKEVAGVNGFDIIMVTTATLEYFSDQTGLIRIIKDNLKKDGVAVIAGMPSVTFENMSNEEFFSLLNKQTEIAQYEFKSPFNLIIRNHYPEIRVPHLELVEQRMRKKEFSRLPVMFENLYRMPEKGKVPGDAIPGSVLPILLLIAGMALDYLFDTGGMAAGSVAAMGATCAMAPALSGVEGPLAAGMKLKGNGLAIPFLNLVELEGIAVKLLSEKERVVIALTGQRGANKTQIAKILKNRFAGAKKNEILVIHQDRIHNLNWTLKARQEAFNKLIADKGTLKRIIIVEGFFASESFGGISVFQKPDITVNIEASEKSRIAKAANISGAYSLISFASIVMDGAEEPLAIAGDYTLTINTDEFIKKQLKHNYLPALIGLSAFLFLLVVAFWPQITAFIQILLHWFVSLPAIFTHLVGVIGLGTVPVAGAAFCLATAPLVCIRNRQGKNALVRIVRYSDLGEEEGEAFIDFYTLAKKIESHSIRPRQEY
ncbi:MAG: hypothetical protein KJ818_04800, partial [Candidatus Omnitrophica bacterium]|nr:hypothetical protein [Candidatus Omnitrophota bacterium]